VEEERSLASLQAEETTWSTKSSATWRRVYDGVRMDGTLGTGDKLF